MIMKLMKSKSMQPMLVMLVLVIVVAKLATPSTDHAADVRANMGKLPAYGFDKALITGNSKIVMQGDQAMLTYPQLETNMAAWNFGDCFSYAFMLRDRLGKLPGVTSAKIGQVILPADLTKGNSHMALWLSFDDGQTITIDPTPLTDGLISTMPKPTFYDESTINALHEGYRNGLSLATGQPMRVTVDPETGQHYYLMASIEKVQALDFNFILHAYAYEPATERAPLQFSRTTVAGARFTADRLAEIRPELKATDFTADSLTFIGNQSSDMKRVLVANSDILYQMVMKLDLESLGAPSSTPEVRFEAQVTDINTKLPVPNVQVYIGGKALEPGQVDWTIDVTGNDEVAIPVRVEAAGYVTWDKGVRMKVKSNKIVHMAVEMKPVTQNY